MMAQRGQKAEQDAPVQSVVRAFRVIEAIEDAGAECGVSEIASGTGLPLPTVHRLLQTLIALGYVRRGTARTYGLGPGLARLGERASGLVSAWARPVLERVQQEVNETVNLAVLDGDRAVYVAQVQSDRQMRMFTELGRRVPLHSTGVGKAILAGLPDERALALVRRRGMSGATTPRTIDDEEALRRELQRIRSRGFAVDDGEQEEGVRCVALIVPGLDTPTALSVSGPDSRITDDSVLALLPLLRQAAQELRGVLRPAAGGAI